MFLKHCENWKCQHYPSLHISGNDHHELIKVLLCECSSGKFTWGLNREDGNLSTRDLTIAPIAPASLGSCGTWACVLKTHPVNRVPEVYPSNGAWMTWSSASWMDPFQHPDQKFVSSQMWNVLSSSNKTQQKLGCFSSGRFQVCHVNKLILIHYSPDGVSY